PVFLLGAQGTQAIEVKGGEDKLQAHAPLHDLRDAAAGGGGAHEGHGDKVVDAPGGITVAVDELVGQIVGLLLAADGGDAAVEVHALLRRGDVLVGDGGRHGEVGGAFRRQLHLLAPLGEHRLLQKFEVHV